jgi:hypothetical protein
LRGDWESKETWVDVKSELIEMCERREREMNGKVRGRETDDCGSEERDEGRRIEEKSTKIKLRE